MNIDELDAQILIHLQKDVRQKAENIARKLHISSATVRRRINRLMQEGILSYYAYVNTDKIGLPFTALIAFYINPDKLDSTMDELKLRKEFTWLAATSGRFNVIARGHFASAEALYGFLREDIPKIQGIINIETFICLHIEKAFYMNLEIVPPQIPD